MIVEMSTGFGREYLRFVLLISFQIPEVNRLAPLFVLLLELEQRYYPRYQHPRRYQQGKLDRDAG